VPAAFKALVKVLAGMFYSGKCPPEEWVDASDPKSHEAPDPDAWQPEKTTAQLAREAKRKQQVGLVCAGGACSARCMLMWMCGRHVQRALRAAWLAQHTRAAQLCEHGSHASLVHAAPRALHAAASRATPRPRCRRAPLRSRCVRSKTPPAWASSCCTR
jgi:hypothetical protein